ncbi:MAG TPA: DUF362 domain-containing protein [Anaerolineae bacterium]|nr:DUF362 domain-containing protein [Anaerolineae bacterium]
MDVSRPHRLMTRRQFVRLAAAAGLGTALGGCGEQQSNLAAIPASPVPPTPMPTLSPTSVPTLVARVPTMPPGRQSSTAAPTATARVPDPTTPLVVHTRQPTATPTPPGAAYLAVGRGPDPRAITRAAVVAIGGIERFVKSGADVIVKPNICVDYHGYEYAATTNPDVVAALVELCLGAGARRVRVMDNPFGGGPQSAYANSGIAAAVAAAGGEMEVMNGNKFVKTPIPDGRDIKKWDIYRDVLEADVVINVPIAKHHNLARLTLGGKNLLGVVTSRGQLHANLGQRVADLLSVVRPTLTVVDAVRILMAHGPTGGNLDDVRLAQTVLASHDPVAADAYAATLFDLAGADIAYVAAAAQMGLGTLELGGVRIEEVAIG